MFQNGSNADGVKIFNGVVTDGVVESAGNVIFSGGSTAGSAEIEILSGSSTVFNDTTTAGNATITSSGLIDFHDGSSAGSATITTTTPFGVTNFHDTSNAGTATFAVGGEGVMNFFNQSSAQAASIQVDGTSSVNFNDRSTAGTAKITAGLAGSNAGNDPIGFTGGFVFFRGTSTAADAKITTHWASNIEFQDTSKAGNATITAPLSGGSIFFENASSADHATIMMLDGTGELSFAPGFFEGGTATAGNATIINSGRTNFFQGSTAGDATITTNAGGVTSFFGRSTGGEAAFITNAGGIVDISGLGTFPDTGNADLGIPPDPPDLSVTGMTAGSIAGAGNYYLGSKQLTVGSNNSDTTVGGVISDCGPTGVACKTPGAGGSLIKVGTGTLTLTGANTYTGGTTISAGTLQLGNGGTSGSIIGDVTDNSVFAINRSNAFSFGGVISGSGAFQQNGTGTTTLTGANTYSGATNVNAGTLQAGALNTFSPSSAVTVASGGTLDLNGFNQTVPSVTNAGLVNMGTGTAPGTILTTTSYTGTGGTMAINTVLGGDNSPSDRLVISGGTASGNTIVHVTNVGGVGAETTNGIPVVSAISGATTTPGAFALPAGELRAGAFDYDLLRGGVSGASPNDWFLRSDFVGAPTTPEPPVSRRLCCRSRHSPLIRRRTRCRPASPFRSSGRNSPPMGWCSLLPGSWGFRSSARSTTGSATPTSRMVAPLRLRSLPPRPRLLRSTCRPRSRRRCRPGSPGLRPARCSRPQSGGASSAKRSTTTIKPSPIPAPAAIWEASRAGSIFCTDL